MRGLDGCYLAFQGALKTLGLVSERVEPPEETGPGGRFGVLDRREGRWPGLRFRLPPSAVYWYGVESAFRRAELWRSDAPFDEVADFIARAAHEALPGASERRAGSRLEVRHRAAGLSTVVRVRLLPGAEAERSLGRSGAPAFQYRDRLQNPDLARADVIR